jgi:2-polyprenyl-6-methoxyphenol hydroxylase-like FAD-dependent oxidoreductase
LETKLLVIADGSNSHCRQKLQIPWGLKNYHQKAVVAKFNSRLAPCIARQWFFKDEVLALLPISHGKVSMVWSQDERKAERMLESQGALIENGLVEILGRNIASKLELDSIPMAAPLTMISVGRYTQSRVILLGDAAHTVHPLAGLGLNMGFFDIIAFSRELESFKDLSSVSFDPGHPKVLKGYSRNRSFRIRTTQALIDTIKYSFAINRPSVNFLRSYGVNFVNHSDFLKRQIVNFATSEF